MSATGLDAQKSKKSLAALGLGEDLGNAQPSASQAMPSLGSTVVTGMAKRINGLTKASEVNAIGISPWAAMAAGRAPEAV